MQHLIRQRIKYLIEQGGVLDDPHYEERRALRWAAWVAAGAAVASTVEFAALLLR